MAILSVDLAYRNYADIGVVVLAESRGQISCRLLTIPLTGEPSPEDLAGYLDEFCLQRRINILLLDGPQAWKAKDSGLVHSRRCERELNTPAKTGEPMSVKPANYGPFVQFSISVYDALTARGWARLATVNSSLGPADRVLIESFPWSAWRSLGIPPLPAKRKTRPADLARGLAALQELFPLRLSREPTHDQLQALVAGLAGLAIERGEWAACAVAGLRPVIEVGCWREGYIVNPLRASVEGAS